MNNDYINRIDNVIKYIKENSNQKLTLDILAGVSNFSKYHFTRIFTSIVGVTPVAFVNQERLQKAVYLLAETNKSRRRICLPIRCLCHIAKWIRTIRTYKTCGIQNTTRWNVCCISILRHN
ncbi:helix-turn-helix domain-containing protein [Paenibacillus sp. FSL M7-1046]|uniref:helix-turn-helix domain-containing protein n=1 Tax=Paenibacillus sp. FSL M7-1046 TaxID=2975315 RepID=UPI0040407115